MYIISDYSVQLYKYHKIIFLKYYSFLDAKDN